MVLLNQYNTYMAHSVVFAAIRTTNTREHFCGKVLIQRVQTMHNTTIVLPVPSTIAWAEIWRDRPFLNRTHLVFDEVFRLEGGRQHDQTPTKIASTLENLPATVIKLNYVERLARLKQVPVFKVLARPGRDSNHANNDLPDMKWAL